MTPFGHSQALTLRQARMLLPGQPARSTISRWVHQGVRGVRLATFLVGGRRYTTREAIERFVAVLSHAAPPDGE